MPRQTLIDRQLKFAVCFANRPAASPAVSRCFFGDGKKTGAPIHRGLRDGVHHQLDRSLVARRTRS